MPAPLDLIHQTSTDTGVGDFTLTSVNGKRDFSEFPGSFDYFISNRSAAEWEIGTTSLVSGILDRTNATILNSSNVVSGVAELVSFSAGTKDVTNDVPAGSQYFAGGTDVAVADGGTGAGTAAGAKTNLGFANIATGAYTGDGATSQAITGVGFQPKFVMLAQRATSDADAVSIFLTWDTVLDDNASGGALLISSGGLVSFRINRIIAFGSDGFTVDDSGSDLAPNSNGTVYNYVAIG